MPNKAILLMRDKEQKKYAARERYNLFSVLGIFRVFSQQHKQ
jgi:DNA polymerase IIIc chi subunit